MSTGAILALLLGGRKKSVDDVEKLYRHISSDVFRQERTAGWGGLLWSHAYYNTEKWETILKEHIGNNCSANIIVYRDRVIFQPVFNGKSIQARRR